LRRLGSEIAADVRIAVVAANASLTFGSGGTEVIIEIRGMRELQSIRTAD
jgi:hypothetical protein